MSKFVRQAVNKFIRASDFQTFDPEVGPKVYTPYGRVNLDNEDNNWNDQCFLKIPKMFVTCLFRTSIQFGTGYTQALTGVQEDIVKDKNIFLLNGGTTETPGNGFLLDGAGAITGHTGDVGFTFDFPSNVLSVPNFSDIDADTDIALFVSDFQGFDVDVVVVYVGDPHHNGSLEIIGQQRVDKFIENYSKWNRVRYRFYLNRSTMTDSIVDFYEELFGQLIDFNVTFKDNLTDFGLEGDETDVAFVQSKFNSYIRTESDIFFRSEI